MALISLPISFCVVTVISLKGSFVLSITLTSCFPDREYHQTKETSSSRKGYNHSSGGITASQHQGINE